MNFRILAIGIYFFRLLLWFWSVLWRFWPDFFRRWAWFGGRRRMIGKRDNWDSYCLSRHYSFHSGARLRRCLSNWRFPESANFWPTRTERFSRAIRKDWPARLRKFRPTRRRCATPTARPPIFSSPILSGKKISNLFQTHPPIAERVKALRGMDV